MNKEETNIFRPIYKDLSEDKKKHIEDVKNKANELWHLLPKNSGKGANREISLAITSFGEAVMWPVKGMTT